MHFQQQIQKIFQTNSIEISSFIIVAWLGRSHYCYDSGKLKVYREVILANIKDNTYNIYNWTKLDNTSNINYRVFRIEILEEELISVKLGDIYNFEGIITNTPRKRLHRGIGLHTFQVTFPKNSEIYYSGIYEFLKDSCYPYYHSSQVYDHAPYYRCLIDETDLILPIQVVNNFFYYQSIKCIQYITQYNIWEFFLDPEEENGEIVIPFYGDFSLNEFVFFSNMLLVEGNEEMNCIRKIAGELRRKSINTHGVINCYFRGKFPFKGDVKLNVIGQYITTSKLGINKFIIYEILELLNVSCSVHNVSRYYLKYLHNPELINKIRLENDISYKKMLDKNVTYWGPINTITPMKDMIRKHYKTTFFNVLFANDKFLKKEKSKANIENKYKLSYKKKENLYQKKNIDYSFGMFKETINYIGSVSDKYVTKIHTIKMHLQSRNKPNTPYILCGHIKYKGINYYLLDYGFGHSIPMFRHKNGAIPMTYEDIEDIILTVQNRETIWQYLYFEQEQDGDIFSVENLYILTLFKHPNIKSNFDKAVLTLSDKICEYLSNDEFIGKILNF